jgi:hypothetical protein
MLARNGYAFGDRIQFGLVTYFSIVGLRGVFTNRAPDMLAAVSPFQVVSALGMTLFFAIHNNAVRLDSSVVRDDCRTVVKIRIGLYSFGEIHP